MSSDNALPDLNNITIDWFKQNIPDFETKPFFTADWFTNGLVNFEFVKAHADSKLSSILEIGSHEGRAACWMLENLLTEDGVITCIDPFGKTPLNAYKNDELPEHRIIQHIHKHNTDLARLPTQTVEVIPAMSYHGLAQLIVDRREYDLIYVDGSHCSDAVLADAAMAFGLLKTGGFMVFDDYLWNESPDVLDHPKMSIDAFVNMFRKHIAIGMINYQYVIQKV
jgi:predicted O-methyltransferase YrrM